MLRTPQAQFHIRFLNLRWIIPAQLDFKNRPFYSVSKFEEISHSEFNSSFDVFDSMDADSISHINTSYVSIHKQHLYYVNIQGLMKQANQIACKSCDELFISLLETYIANKNKEALEFEQLNQNVDQTDSSEIDQENVNKIGNPLIRRPKGRPAGTARFKGPLETSNAGNRTQNKCGLCNNVGHNRATCPSNPGRKKRRQEV
ncbi:7398_t:CDS:1 [Funneliformis geosporum]|uniref:8588_t:CDS:1 n=1 Tax=Funneliformis geosporum TaxID=1117311 RepID=A0A9W4SJH5_9GLOM|nr:8588_t:CDS:1 [Funneliformis geosporum]CAI2181467.1 7398_t:CDS:1 [Funneliformis geosporum]